MITQLFATKTGMGQVWTKTGRRMPITRLTVGPNAVVSVNSKSKPEELRAQIGYGTKKLKNLSKPLRTQLEKGGFSFGVRQLREVVISDQGNNTLKVGDIVKVADVVKVGDLVNVQAHTKGRGFAGVMKRHGFHGGPKTHGQSDRGRAPGSIGSGTTPGRVLKGKRMAGHYGNTVFSVKNLIVVHMDEVANELWVSGPVPGHLNATVRLSVIGDSKFDGLDEVSIKQPAVSEEVITEAGHEGLPEVSDAQTASEPAAVEEQATAAELTEENSQK